LVTLDIDRSVATLTMDDGKRNALSPAMFDEIYAALDRVEREGAAVVITGREGVLSAGFDLKVMKSGGVQAVKMLRAGYALTARLGSGAQLRLVESLQPAAAPHGTLREPSKKKGT
jgi:enoyl-CoA hydratase